MILNTKYHGTREYDKNDVITFNKGLPGFETLQKFILFPLEDNDVFSVLHSVEDEEIGFIVVSPFYVMQDYEIDIDDEKLKEMEIQSSEDVFVLNIVHVSSKIENITVNMRAPIVINIKSNFGEQIILNSEKFSIKQSLIKQPLIKEE